MDNRSIIKVVSVLTFALLLTLPLANGVDTVDTIEQNQGITRAQERVENGTTYRNASANGSATFLRVDGYHPWAGIAVNAGSPRGVDKVVLTFSNQTLNIEVTDDNHTNHITILVNKGFAEEYIANSSMNIDFNLSDAVNYEGLDNSNESADDGAVYVFHIEHFSTQTIELSRQVTGPSNDFEPPVEGGEAFNNQAQNAAANGAATFLRVEGYKPWAVLVINAGNPHGVDSVTATFENETLTIEATDSNSTNHVTILVNKGFADEYLADSEGDLDINVSDAVNYEGLDNSNESAGNGAVYVFHIEHFSTQTIEMSSKESIPFVSVPVFLVISIIPVAIYSKFRKE